MVYYSMTEEGQKAILKSMNMYLRRASRYTEVIPTAQIPEKNQIEFYRVLEMTIPKWGVDDSKVVPAIGGLEVYTNNVAWLNHDFDFQRHIMTMSSEYGLPIVDATTMSSFKHFGRGLAQACYQGATEAMLEGLTNISSPTGKNTSTYNTVKWNTAYGPQGAARNMAATLETDGLDAPFALILGNGCQSGIYTAVGTATADMNIHGLNFIVSARGPGKTGDWENSVIIFEDFGADTATVINPLPAAGAADNVGILCKPGSEHFQFLVALAPSLKIGEPDVHSNRVPAKIKAAVSVIVPHPKAICYHDRIDYA
jgi:hypothetical protein